MEVLVRLGHLQWDGRGGSRAAVDGRAPQGPASGGREVGVAGGRGGGRGKLWEVGVGEWGYHSNHII